MKEQNAWVAVAVVVIVAVVAAYFGFMMGSRPAYSPTSSGSGISVTGTYNGGGSSIGIYGVYIDLNGDGTDDKFVKMSRELALQFGNFEGPQGSWQSTMPKGTKVTFSDCTVTGGAGGNYECKSKHVNPPSNSLADSGAE